VSTLLGIAAVIVVALATVAITYAIIRLNRYLDRRADAWNRNHARRRRWWE
jgi:4-hydroxybenzoate polyprenyltransferase